MSYRDGTKAALPPVRPTLIYDDDCGLCVAAAGWLAALARARVDLVAFSELKRGLLDDLTAHEIRRSAHFVSPEGVEFHGAAAITGALRLTRYAPLGVIADIPGLSLLRDLGYWIVERNRDRLGRLIGAPACRVPE